MKCKIGMEMSEYKKITLFECPACCTIFMPDISRIRVLEMLFKKNKHKNIKKLLNKEIERHLKKVLSHKILKKDLPKSDPNWKDPFPSDKKGDGFVKLP